MRRLSDGPACARCRAVSIVPFPLVFCFRLQGKDSEIYFIVIAHCIYIHINGMFVVLPVAKPGSSMLWHGALALCFAVRHGSSGGVVAREYSTSPCIALCSDVSLIPILYFGSLSPLLRQLNISFFVVVES